tara:strand:- start:236 stop:919 length:684 start_codon:yes stop_codon:yes gene_type:complete
MGKATRTSHFCIYSGKKSPAYVTSFEVGDVESQNLGEVAQATAESALDFEDDVIYECDDASYISFLVRTDWTSSSCCDRLRKSHAQLIAGGTFIAVALLGSIISISKNKNWHKTEHIIHFVVYTVATALLASAVFYSELNGPLSCDESMKDEFELAKSDPRVTKYTLSESRESGFWLLVICLAFTAALTLGQTIIMILTWRKIIDSPYTSFSSAISAPAQPTGSLFF